MNKKQVALIFLSASSFAIAQTSETSPIKESTQAVVQQKPADTAPTGLTTETATVAVAVTRTEVCCKQYTEFSKTALPLTLTKIFLDEKTPVYDFGNKPQAYVLLELPQFTEPYSFIVHNFPLAPGIFNRTSYTQIPLRIEMFDENFVSKRMYRHFGMKKHGIGFDKTVFINPQNQTERYALIYGDLTAAPEEATISQRDTIFVGTGFFVGGEDKKISLSASDKGLITVEAKGLKEVK